MRVERPYAATMLSTTPYAATLSAAAVLLGSLGLGGCSTGANTTITHTPALQTAGGRDTARSGVQAAILIADTTNGIALPGGPTPAGIARRVSAMIHGGRGTRATGTSTGACSSGVKSSSVTNSDGSKSTTTDYYYEPTCATLEVEEVINITTPGTPGTTDGSGTITSYSNAGAVRVVEKLILNVLTTSTGEETFTMSVTASAAAGGTTTSAIGATCVGTPPSQTVNCAVAHYGLSAGVVSGEAIGTGATAGTGGGNATATVNVAFYAATTLGITQSGTSWGVSGNSAFNSATGSYGYTTTGPSGAGTLTLKDVLYTYRETATLSSTGLSVTIVEDPNGIITTTIPIATATVDVAGTGVMTFADGTSEPIAGGLIGY
jgi:hypothetical protein